MGIYSVVVVLTERSRRVMLQTNFSPGIALFNLRALTNLVEKRKSTDRPSPPELILAQHGASHQYGSLI
eukprot:6188949-Pleurochrysis_carterae.AAC.1